MGVKVKICGLRRAEDAELALKEGADWLGFVHEPSSPRCIEEGDTEWIARLDADTLRVAVFGPFRPGCDLSAFHLVQSLTEPEDWPTAKTLQALRLAPGQDPGEATVQPKWGSTVVLDAFSADGYGGTGELVDWADAAMLVRQMDVPVILAGGLNPHNVAEAIQAVRPYAVDVSSGVEASPGVKDPAKVRDFIQAVREA